jgi:hypothetical protein
MVCFACNGKGYVIERNHEVVCSDCQGRGDYIIFDNEWHHKQEPQEVHVAR